MTRSRSGFARGGYKYFAAPLPPITQTLRPALYPPLALVAKLRTQLSESPIAGIRGMGVLGMNRSLCLQLLNGTGRLNPMSARLRSCRNRRRLLIALM